MKIKIKTNLSERFVISSKMSAEFMLDKIFNPESEDSIIGKKLIFYDLETNGFLPDAYVHQIAALEFDLSNPIRQIFNGEQPTIPESAEGGIVVKAKFKSSQFKQKDARTISSRGKLRRTTFSRKTREIDEVPFLVGKNKITGKGRNRFKTNLFMSPDDKLAVMGSVMAKNSKSREDISKSLTTLFYFLSTDGIELSDNLKSLMDTCLNEQTGGNGDKIYSIKDPEFLLKNDTLSDNADEFFISIARMMQILSSAPYAYPAKRKGKRRGATVSIENALKGYRQSLGMTYAENKAFTRYDEFPLDKYSNLQYTVDGKLPNEKQAISAFLKYLKTLGKNNYILIGHNIRSFDNNVILQRGAINGVSKSDLKFFQDSLELDTLNLMNLYKKQIQFFDSKVDEINNSLMTSQATQAVATRASQNAQTLIAKYETLKAKLEGLMKLHDATKDFEQTHTADDDCEKLAQVTVPTILEIFEMNIAFKEISNVLDVGKGSSQKSFLTRPFAPSEIASDIFSKIKGDIDQGNVLSADDAKMISGEEDEKNAYNKTIKMFVKDLVKEVISNQKDDKTREEIMYFLNNLKNVQVIRQFLPWLESKKSELSPQPEVDSALQQVDPEQLDSLDIPDFGPTNLSESIKNKWKRMIK